MTFRLTPLNHFYLAMMLSTFYFWTALAIPYLSYRHIPIDQIFTLLTFYNISTVILEYPTGVIGDVFGYKFSVIIGNILGIISMIMLAQSGTYIWYLASIMCLALAVSSISGSDMGMLNAVAKDSIKKASAQYKFLADMTFFTAAVTGGLIARISFSGALYFNAAVWCVATIALLTLKIIQVKDRSESNIYATAKQGFHYIGANRRLLAIVIIGAFIGGFGLNIKYIFGSMTQLFNFSVDQIGWLVGIGILVRGFGAKLYPRFEINLGFIGSIIVGLVVIAGLVPPLISVASLFAIQVLMGYFLAASDAQTHELSVDKYRASIFSSKKLVSRLFTALYIAYVGYILKVSSFATLMVTTGVILTIGVVIYYQFSASKVRTKTA